MLEDTVSDDSPETGKVPDEGAPFGAEPVAAEPVAELAGEMASEPVAEPPGPVTEAGNDEPVGGEEDDGAKTE